MSILSFRSAIAHFGAAFLTTVAFATAPLEVSFTNSFVNGVFGPFNTSSSVVIRATLTNTSLTDTLTICDGICLGDRNTYSLGGQASIPKGYSFYFGSTDNAPSMPYDGQVSGSLAAGQSKDFIFGVYTPDENLKAGWVPFFTQVQVFDASPDRNWVTASTFSGRWEVTPVPEPETYALMLAGLGIVGAVARRRRLSPTPA